jgi:nitroreductase
MAELWDPWQISEGAFSKTGTSSDKLRFLLNYAVLAPSNHNAQPWLFRIVSDGIELYADRTRALPVVDPEDRELVMGCGAALFNLRVAFRHFGYETIVRSFPDANKPDLLARVNFGEGNAASAEEHALFQAITKRRTNRMPFGTQPVSESLLRELQAAATKEGAWLHIVLGDHDRNMVADLIAKGDRIQMSDGHFRRELAAWIHPSRTASHDGTPGYAIGFSGVTSYLGPLVVRTFDMGSGRAAKDRQLANGSPVLAVLGTQNDTPADWLWAGQALARVLLRARVDDVWASFLNQPIEVPELRIQLRDLLSLKGFPQILLRMGYGQDVKPTPRRTPGEVLMRERLR